MEVRRETFAVRSYEVDAFDTLALPALAGYLQEVAGLHAAEMGCGMEDLMGRGLTWVLLRQRIEIARPARLGDLLEIATWPSGVERLAALRDFEVRRQDGTPVARAATQWLVVDLARRRPVRPDKVLDEPFRRDGNHVFPDFGSDLPDPAGWEAERALEIRYRDIDRNLHVNNAAYVGWAIESVPYETWRSCRVAAVEAHFLAEARHGGGVLARSSRLDAHRLLHGVFGAQDGKELARLRTTWAQRDGPER